MSVEEEKEKLAAELRARREKSGRLFEPVSPERGFSQHCEQGPQGEEGPPGLEGPEGPQGEQGEQGEPGPQGEPGTDGTDGAAGSRGDPGSQGPPGADGKDGKLGPKGDKGDKGEKGEQGPEGPRGKKGKDADPAEVWVGAGGGGGGSTPTGTGFRHVTAGVEDAASKAVDLASADVTGLLPAANIDAAIAREAEVTTEIATHAAISSAHHAEAHGIAAHTEHAAWKLMYADGSGDEQEISLGAAGAQLQCNGIAAAPTIVVPNRSMMVMAPSFSPTTTAPCSDLTQVEAGTNDVDYFVLDFSPTTTEYAFANIMLPDNLNGQVALTVSFVWTAAAGTGDVQWGAKALVLVEGDPIDTAYGSAFTVTDSVTVNNDLHVTATSSLTPGGSYTSTSRRFLHLKVYRNIAAGDTLDTNDARLIGVVIEYATNAVSD